MDASVGFGEQSRNVNVSNQKKSKERKKQMSAVEGKHL